MVERWLPMFQFRTGRGLRSDGRTAVRHLASRWAILLLVAIGALVPWSAMAQESPGGDASVVYVIPIHGSIEPGIGHFLERSLDEAEAAGATAVILDINTPGGRLDTVLEMRDAILDSPLRTIAFVNREAFSAGALITIASQEIWLTPGGVFGVATPVLGGETADAKTISAVRATFRATAETRGRDPAIAEAMVDPAVEIPGLDSASTLLSLSSDQALQWQYANGTAGSMEDLLAQTGLAGAEVREMSPAFIETVVRWVTEPLVASILILIGIYVIVADALFGGFGIGAVAGVACLALFFWGHLLANLAGWEDLVLIVLGLALIALEIFVIPGFGVAGILGALALGGGLFLSMVGTGYHDFDVQGDAVRAGWVIVGALAGAIVGLVSLGLVLSRVVGTSRWQQRGLGGLMLPATVGGSAGADRRAREPGWLVRKVGGGGVLERGESPPIPEADPPPRA